MQGISGLLTTRNPDFWLHRSFPKGLCPYLPGSPLNGAAGLSAAALHCIQEATIGAAPAATPEKQVRPLSAQGEAQEEAQTGEKDAAVAVVGGGEVGGEAEAVERPKEEKREGVLAGAGSTSPGPGGGLALVGGNGSAGGGREPSRGDRGQ